MNNRRSGHNFERNLAERLRAAGFTDCQTSRAESRRRDDAGVDFCFTGPLNIQAKRTLTAPNFQTALGAMPDEQGQVNVVVHHRPRKGAVVVIGAEDFFEIIETLLAEKIWKA